MLDRSRAQVKQSKSKVLAGRRQVKRGVPVLRTGASGATSPRVLADAQDEAVRVYQKAGVAISWIGCKSQLISALMIGEDVSACPLSQL